MARGSSAPDTGVACKYCGKLVAKVGVWCPSCRQGAGVGKLGTPGYRGVPLAVVTWNPA